MIRIIDSTLAMLDKYEPTKAQLLKFCELMKQVGIIDLEISIDMCKIIGQLPTGFRFYLAPDTKGLDKAGLNIYKEIKGHSEEEGVLSQFQINDIREIVQLRPYSNCRYIRIIGLDDLICHDYNYVIREIKEILSQSIVNFCPENSFYCATALAVEWLLSGQNEVTTSLTGIGNRAATEEVLMALKINTRYKNKYNMRIFKELKVLIEEITSVLLSPTKPIIGDDIFLIESGIHVDGIVKKPANYTPYAPEEIGQKMCITMGKHSGSTAIIEKLKECGMPIEDKQCIAEILRAVKKKSIRQKRGLSNEEFLELVRGVINDERKEMGS